MPDFLPTRNTLKCQVAKSFCSSYRYNSRNLEGLWYGPWCQVLSDLVDHFNNLIVIPQFPMWFTPGDDESEESEDEQGSAGDDIDEMDLFVEERDHDEQDVEHRELHQNETDIGNTTSDSIGTLADGTAAELFPDFAVIHLLAKRLPQGHPRFRSLGGIKITHECCPIVVENKKFPRRRLTGDEFRNAADVLLYEAREQLGMQCYHLFQKYPHSITTIAIAAAGDLWTCRKVRRDEVPRPAGDHMDTDGWDGLIWRPYVRLGSVESDVMLEEIHDTLKLKSALKLN